MKVLLVAYDNGSYIHWFPQGLAYIASALRDKGHDVSVYSQDQYHYPESHLVDFLSKECFDVVGLSVVGGYYQYRKLLKISAAINSVGNRPFYILGGHGPSPEPEYFLRKSKADCIVIGEGELTAVELLDALERKRELSSVDGIAYLDDQEQLVVSKERKVIKDIDSIAFPAWDLFPIDYYALKDAVGKPKNTRTLPVLSSRGCPFKCNFCYRLEKGYRARSPESIVEELQILKTDYGIHHFQFGDELVMLSEKRTVELCEAFIRAELNVTWDCNGRLNYAKPSVLSTMKKAGCVFINYGIESLDDEMLRVMNKKLTVAQIIRGVEATIASGISPGLNIIFGNIAETREILQSGVEFLLKYDQHINLRTIRPVTPYPGSPLYYYAIEKGLLKDCADFYEKKHLNSDLLTVNFTDMSDEEVHGALFEANKKLIKRYFEQKYDATMAEAEGLYLNHDANFRGFRQT